MIDGIPNRPLIFLLLLNDVPIGMPHFPRRFWDVAVAAILFIPLGPGGTIHGRPVVGLAQGHGDQPKGFSMDIYKVRSQVPLILLVYELRLTL